MKARHDLAQAEGCNDLKPDNVDGYANTPCFPLNPVTQLNFHIFLSTEAHARNLAISMKTK